MINPQLVLLELRYKNPFLQHNKKKHNYVNGSCPREQQQALDRTPRHLKNPSIPFTLGTRQHSDGRHRC